MIKAELELTCWRQNDLQWNGDNVDDHTQIAKFGKSQHFVSTT